MQRNACLTLTVALALALPASVRADLCGDYRLSIDAYIEAVDTRAAIDEALEAARNGIRAARASRSAFKALNEEDTLRIIEAAGVRDALEAAGAASTGLGEAFEAVHKRVTETTAQLGTANATALEDARIEANEGAVAALDSLSRFKAVGRSAALKATSAAAEASPGATTSKALVAVHESIFRAACE